VGRYTDFFDPETYLFDGRGYARGLDVFWRDSKSIANTDFWISYSFLDTKRLYQDFPNEVAPSFASAHNFSLVTKTFVTEIKSQIGLTYSFASPRSYHNPNDSDFMSGRTPSYHDLSFNVSYLMNSQVIVHAMVNNALGIKNVFGYRYADEPNAEGVFARRPIGPAAPRILFLGVFITLSK